MAYHKLRLLLVAVMCLLACGGTLIAGTLFLLPLAITVNDTTPLVQKQPPVKERANYRARVEDFGLLLGKRFQEPLEDTPSVPAKSAEQPSPASAPMPLAVVLLGTAVESTAKSSKAWVRAAGQPVRLLSVGEKLLDLPGEPELVSVEVGRVVLRVGGRDETITMKKQDVK